MKTKQFADACGVDKKTLFYYDEIGLLKPMRVLENGYREYDEIQLTRMGTIKLMQASGMSLKEIGSIIGMDGKPSTAISAEDSLKTINECCTRVESLIAELQSGLNYIYFKRLIRDDYMIHHGDSVDSQCAECCEGCAHSSDEMHSQATVNIYTRLMPELRISTKQIEYRENMSVNYLTTGLFLSVAEDIETMKPKYFFRPAESKHEDAVIPAGRYACAFYERAVGSSFVLPLLGKDFLRRLEKMGLEHDDTLYAHDLPCWLVGKENMLIYGFCVRLKES
ncbi:MAG: MerR family transcriptional regulator [Clostridia bacterium]|nr:MerR family transcriptional regulator [Clostridia bacterium]